MGRLLHLVCFLQSLLGVTVTSLRRLILARCASLVHLPVAWLAPRPGDVTISPRWLQHVLRDQGILQDNVGVSGATMEPVDENRGLGAVMIRVRLSYSTSSRSSSSSNQEGPATLILKRSNGALRERRSLILGGGHREAKFYGDTIARRLPAGLLPRVFFAWSSPLLGEFVVLMEDLLARDVTGVNMVFGNQVWGVPRPVKPPRDSIRVLEAMFLKSAEMHAAFWRDPSLLKRSWLKGAPWYGGRERAAWEQGIETARRGWASKGADIDISPKLAGILDRAFETASWEALQTRLRDPAVPWTLCHGDFHASNLFLLNSAAAGEEEGGLVLFDWTEVGPWEPTTDLAQTVISDVKAELFVTHTRPLVRKYWERLLVLGVTAESYPFEMCWESFCHGGVERWLWIFSVLCGMPHIPAQATQYFHDQLLAFIESHGDHPHYHLKPLICLAM